MCNIWCGDFNARCGSLEADSESLPTRRVIDSVKNSQGETFVDFLRSVDMCVVNGRKGRDMFTCVSNRGRSVVDYCVVGVENFDMIHDFRVTTMRESIDEMRLKGEVTRVPDHSLVQWEVLMNGVEHKDGKGSQDSNKKRYVVPENYLEANVEDIRRLAQRVASMGKDQKAVDEVYDELMGIMNNGQREITMKGNERRQPWFTHESAKLRKEFHRAEKEWLGCRDNELRKRKRSAYLEKRRVYKRAVGRAKKRYVEHKCSELEGMVRKPKKWWSMVKKLKMAGRRGDQADTTKVSDPPFTWTPQKWVEPGFNPLYTFHMRTSNRVQPAFYTRVQPTSEGGLNSHLSEFEVLEKMADRGRMRTNAEIPLVLNVWS